MASKLKPKMLKEFLGDTANYDSSSNGFDSHPRSLPDCHSDPNFRRLLEQGKAGNNDRLPRSRSRSRAAAEAAVSSFQKLLNAVKSLQYSSTPSTLPRSLSRRFLDKWPMKKKKSNSSSSSNDVASGGGSKIVVVTVKVKDILRWRSFHHHHHHQVSESEEERESQASVLVGPAFDAPSTSDASVDDIFTVAEEEEEEGEDDYLPCCRDDDAGEKWEEVVASDSEMGPKEGYHKISSEEDTVQQSPISILDSPFRDEVSDEENLSTFDQSLANMERTKQRLLQSLQLFESLAGVHDDDDDDDDEETEEELPREDDDTVKAKSRGFCWFERGGEGLKDKQKCIRSMELQGQWSKFEDERPEIGIELEDAILNDLLDEVLFDLC